MREIKFRVFDSKLNEYCEDPDFRYSLSRKGLLYNSEDDKWHKLGNRYIVELFTGLTDKNGKEIFEGDAIRVFCPVRLMQTHRGDNIPSGSYTEPAEADIEEGIYEVVFKNGCFMAYNEDLSEWEVMPLDQHIDEWDKGGILGAIAMYSGVFFDNSDQGEEELSFLIEEKGFENVDELIDHINGVEIIGNIHEIN